MLDAVVDYSVAWLNGTTPLDPQSVGAKAATLSALLREGYAVPRGFVIPPLYFQQLLQRLRLPAPLFTDFPQSQLHLNAKNALQLWEVADTLQQSLQQLAFPADWEYPLRQALGYLLDPVLKETESRTEPIPGFFPCILRPSLISPPHSSRSILPISHPMATTGILEAVVTAFPRSFLLREGGGEMARFWTDLRSLYSQCVQARSLLYWQQKGCSLHQLQIAVLVQPLLPALATGTIVVDPDPTDPMDMRIEATWGLGFSLDRGEILPDQYQVKSTTRPLLGKLKPESKSVTHSEDHPATHPGTPALRYSWTEKRGRKPLIYMHAWQSPRPGRKPQFLNPASPSLSLNAQSLNAQSLNAQSPNAQSPNAQSLNAQSPNFQSPNAQSLNAQSPNAQSLNAQSPNAQSLNAQSLNAQSLNAQSPNAQSPNAQSPNAQSPNAQSLNAQSPNAQSLNAQSPNAQSLNAQSLNAQSYLAADLGLDLFPPLDPTRLAPSIAPEESETPFRIQGIAPSHYTDPALTPEQLQDLMNAAFPYLETHPWVKRLDWVLCPENYLSAVLPPGFAPSSPFLWIQCESFDRWQTSIAPSLPPSLSSGILSQGTKPKESEPQGSDHQGSDHQGAEPKMFVPPTILKGEAASGGYSVGQLYWIRDLVQDREGEAVFLPDYPIFVGQQLTLDALPFLQRSLGLVLAQGGLTSHGAIMARELNIPAVVGLGSRIEQILQTLPPRTWLAVDGDRGVVKVLAHPPDLTLAPVSSKGTDSQTLRSHSLPLFSAPLDPMTIETETGAVDPSLLACLLPPVSSQASPSITATRLLTTINQFSSLKPLATQTSDGIGLLRSEWLFLDLLEQQHPIVWINQGRQAELIDRFRDRLQDCIAAVHPNPVFYRSFDCRAAELQQLQGLDDRLIRGDRSSGIPSPVAHSPATANLNWRVGGTLSHCLDPRVLDLELAVLHQVDRLGSPIHLLLPMLRTVEEFIFCRDRVRKWTTFPPQNISLWIMAEVPSVLLLLPELVKAGVEGIAIGSGDLAQYLLGIDRDAGGVYGLDHPVVHQAILHLLRQAKELSIPVTLCSHLSRQGIGFPDGHLEAYIQLGLWGITTELPHLPVLRQKVAQAEQRLMLHSFRQVNKVR